jgi:hypothetical protein
VGTGAFARPVKRSEASRHPRQMLKMGIYSKAVMPKKYPKGHYNPNVEVRVKKTARKKRAVILTIFLPTGKSSTLYEQLEAALKKQPKPRKK